MRRQSRDSRKKSLEGSIGSGAGSILCVCVKLRSPSWADLWRFLLPPLAQPHAAQIDELVMTHFTRLTAIPTDLPLTRDILNYPLAQGGLNLVQHRIEAQIHFLSGAMALQLNSDSLSGAGLILPMWP